jgi:hypothetical protein
MLCIKHFAIQFPRRLRETPNTRIPLNFSTGGLGSEAAVEKKTKKNRRSGEPGREAS